MKEITASESKDITGGVHFPTPIEHGGIGLNEYPSFTEIVEDFESFSNACIAYTYFRALGIACVFEAKVKHAFAE